MHSSALIACALIALAAPAPAQVAGATAAESALGRAQRLANEGNPAAGRVLVDSVLATSSEGSASYVEALYWRARLAESVDQARRDYMQIAVEFSLNRRAEDSLMRLAQLEYARGDRAATKKLLARLDLEFASGTTRPQALYLMGRVLLDEGALPQACASLSEAQTRVSSIEVELANRISYYARPCAAVQHAADSLRADSVARVDSLSRADSVARVAAAHKTRPASGATPKRDRQSAKGGASSPEWTVQVAAFAQKADAERLAKQLATRGYDARVTSGQPYRVRIGRYEKRATALALAEKLKASRTPAIVVEAEKP